MEHRRRADPRDKWIDPIKRMVNDAARMGLRVVGRLLLRGELFCEPAGLVVQITVEASGLGVGVIPPEGRRHEGVMTEQPTSP